MSDEKDKVEHHFHQPTSRQVSVAMRQHLTDMGVTDEKIREVVNKKVEEVTERYINRMFADSRFDKLVVAAIANALSSDKKAFEANRYGWNNHLRDLVKAELQRLVLSQYEVSVTPKKETP